MAQVDKTDLPSQNNVHIASDIRKDHAEQLKQAELGTTSKGNTRGERGVRGCVGVVA